MKVRIEIDTKTFVRFWLVVIGFAFAILLLYSARTALVIVGVSLFLALALNAPVSRLARKLPDRSRMLSTAISFVVVIAALSAIVFLVVPPIVQQTQKFVDSAPTMIAEVSKQWKGVGALIDKYNLQPQIDQAIQSVKDSAGGYLTNLGSNFLSGVGSALAIGAAMLIVLVMTFLMLVEGPVWLDRAWKLYTDSTRMQRHRKILGRMNRVVASYVTGQLTVSGIDGLVSGVTVFILSLFFPEVPANLAFTSIGVAFVLSLIPQFGATIAGIIISLLIALNSLPAAVIFLVAFFIYQQVENNFVVPIVQSRGIELSPLVVLVSVTIGIYMFGIAGGIISIPIAGCAKVLIEEYLQHAKQQRQEKDRPVAKLVRKIQGAEEA